MAIPMPMRRGAGWRSCGLRSLMPSSSGSEHSVFSLVPIYGLYLLPMYGFHGRSG
jgi:hypothetical protein